MRLKIHSKYFPDYIWSVNLFMVMGRGKSERDQIRKNVRKSWP